MSASELHGEVVRAFNAGDVDSLVALYEAGAAMVGPDGLTIEGHQAIREQWTNVTSTRGTMTSKTMLAVEIGDIALLSGQWSIVAAGFEIGSTSAEVARRQPDGTWLYVIDNPFAAGAPSSA